MKIQGTPWRVSSHGDGGVEQEGIEVVDPFGELRSLLNDKPSHRVWLRCVSWLERCDETALRHEIVPYCRHHLARWPAGLRHAPARWLSELLDDRAAAYLALADRLTLRDRGLDDQQMQAIARSGHLDDVVVLSAARNNVSAACLPALRRASRLRRLSLWGNVIGLGADEGLSLGAWPALEELDLHWNQIDDRGLARLAASSLPALRFLRLGRNRLSSRGLAALDRLALEALELGHNRLGPGGTAPVGRWQHLRPRQLGLRANRLGLRDLEVLGDAAALDQVEVLDLGQNRFGDAGAEVLARAGWAARLRSLALDDCGLGAQGLEALAQAAHALRTLQLSGSPLGDAAIARLVGTPAAASLTIVDLRDCRLRAPLPTGARFDALRELNLGWNHLDLEAVLSWVRACPRLERLELIGNPLGAQADVLRQRLPETLRYVGCKGCGDQDASASER